MPFERSSGSETLAESPLSAPGPTAGGKQKINILTFSTLFPSSAQPIHGIFVERRLLELVGSGEVCATVLAPVPWFPFTAERFGSYAAWARTPLLETRNGLEVHHPRYPVVPKVGMSLAPSLLYGSSKRYLERLLKAGRQFDLIDAHYFYPDGVAALRLGRHFGLPVVVTARGSDLNLISKFRGPRRLIAEAAKQADGLITVTQALKSELVALGVTADRVTVLRNGVDLELFRPLERAAARRQLDVSGPLVLSVGHLIDRKGHDLVIQAVARLKGVKLLIVGDGPERARLSKLIGSLNLQDRVKLVGAVPQQDLPLYYSATDALVLASSREGWANVLLEAMACGTPVVATDIPGTREVVTSAAAGILVARRSPSEIAEGIRSILSALRRREDTRHYAQQFGWQETTAGQLRLWGQVMKANR